MVCILVYQLLIVVLRGLFNFAREWQAFLWETLERKSTYLIFWEKEKLLIYF